MNLVSDDIGTGLWDVNKGSTLPEGMLATHNASFAPIFFGRTSTISMISTEYTEPQMTGRGRLGRWYASTSGSWHTWSYYSVVDEDYVSPSADGSRAVGRSLRCLVSTTNS